MNTQQTAGQALRAHLDEALPKGVVWTKIELATLANVEVMADRLARLRLASTPRLTIPSRRRPRWPRWPMRCDAWRCRCTD